jgi:hypothetical protein
VVGRFFLLTTEGTSCGAFPTLFFKNFSHEYVVVDQRPDEDVHLWQCFGIPNTFPERRVGFHAMNSFKLFITLGCSVFSREIALAMRIHRGGRENGFTLKSVVQENFFIVKMTWTDRDAPFLPSSVTVPA